MTNKYLLTCLLKLLTSDKFSVEDSFSFAEGTMNNKKDHSCDVGFENESYFQKNYIEESFSRKKTTP